MQTYIGKSLLQHCICYDHGTKFVEYIINNSNIDVNKPDKMGRTALFEACYLGNHHSVKLLLIKGADWNIVNELFFGFHCLHVCLFRKKYMCLLAVLKHGVKLIDEKLAEELKKSCADLEYKYRDLKMQS